MSAILFHKPYELIRIHDAIQLADVVLKRYVGEYVLMKKHHAFITLENNSLQMEAPAAGLPKSPLFAQDETSLYLKVVDARIEFVKDRTFGGRNAEMKNLYLLHA